MKRIREGNDFDVAWAIERAGVPEDFTTAIEKRLTMIVYGNVIEHSLYTITDNILSINVPKEVAHFLGDYRLVFEYTLPDLGQPDGDLKCKTDVIAFRIVPTAADADLDMTVDVASDVAIGFKGDEGDPGVDAYQIWIDMGNTGTYADYLIWQRAPAVDAASTLDQLETEVSGNETTRQQNETGRVTAEGLRVTAETGRSNAESSRVTVEGERVTAEGSRATAESARVTAEGNRVSAETTRGNNEATRVSQETGRNTAEGNRVTAENGRVTKEGTRVTAEDGRVSAETTRNTNEGIRQSQEAARQTNTNTAIGNANNAAQAANTAAGLADDARLAIQSDLALKLESVEYSSTEFNEV